MTHRHRTRHSYVFLFIIIALLALVMTASTRRHLSRPLGILYGLSHGSTVIDLASGDYRVTPALAQTGGRETFSELVARLKPHAAITGTFYGSDHAPLGDIMIDGKLVNRGFQRQGIGFTRGGKIKFLERQGASRINWQGCRTGIACGPRLIRKGKIEINVRRDGFGPAAARLKATRCAVGSTRDGKLVMLAITDPVTLETLAKAMLELGAVDAINLDGGALCGLYADGKCQAEPILPINNVLAIYRMK